MSAALLQDSPSSRKRASEYFHASADSQNASVDRMMAWLLILEWVGIVVLAAIFGPFTWTGTLRQWNPHFLAAVLSGPSFILPCIAVTLLRPGRHVTRHAVAVAQMLVSVVLIDVTHGRIETHFHVFGSLAFLSFYRDWRVLVTASAVAAVNHIAGYWLPLSVYGVATVEPYRWLEHVWWVVFEDFFLLLAIRRSVTESKELARGKSLLYEGAYHDVLTGLPNRRLLQERFETSCSKVPAEPKAILFVDLDRFKQANDLHGHTVGDKLLVEVAARLTGSIDSSATLARIGGDEFNVFLPNTTEAAARETGSRLIQSLSDPFFIDGHSLLLSATVGIAVYPEHGRSLVLLQERADEAMYFAKANGRNQVSLYRAENAVCKSKIEEIARDLFAAQSKGQFNLDFQPLIAKGDVFGFEALLRWVHPVHGLIPPAEFIPIAERSGLIAPIGAWVLSEASRQCRLWQAGRSEPLVVAVNVSAVQFEQPAFPAQVRAILNETGLNPNLLTLEVTEGILIRDVAKARSHLDDLRSIGVHIALDDFGTGYSSLSYLSELPADSIKLDRSFVQREFGKHSSILESVVEMAHRLNLRVTAEGVESQAEADWLLNLNCDKLQGFFFSRPIPATSVPEYLASRLKVNAAEPNIPLARVA